MTSGTHYFSIFFVDEQPMIVRDLGRNLARVELSITGETEIDRRIMAEDERSVDPSDRNCIDFGIENLM